MGLLMGRMVGYMLTWSTYGSWLQGDEKGYVKRGKVLGGNRALENSNLASLVKEKVFLTDQQRKVVHDAILEEAARYGQPVHALSVLSEHVHLVLGCVDRLSIERAVCSYKNATISAMVASGFAGKVWTKGYDKRFCYDEQSLRARIAYVHRHRE